jgi:dihydrofolate reductase (trimethoprim resistance protein)
MTTVVKHLQAIYSQREEILTAFVAKYGFHPEQAVQVEQRADDGTTSWHVRLRQGAEKPDLPHAHTKFAIGDSVYKIKGSQWSGTVVGWYSTSLTPEGYAVESSTEKGSVQIYPGAALAKKPDRALDSPSF